MKRLREAELLNPSGRKQMNGKSQLSAKKMRIVE